MAVKPVPDGYQTVTPYLVAKGAAGLLDFITKAFDGETIVRMDNPDGSVGHAEIHLGDSKVMVGDASEEWSP
ncbi:MAG: VOC family protein, partial [Actinomycetota bacterium]|nr:VOC family protein [Actinomycetota bacterium]